MSGEEFDPTGQTGMITLTFTPTADCAIAATTEIEVTDEVTPVLELGGEICSSANVLDLNSLEDASFPDGTWSGTGVSGEEFNPTGQMGMITLTFTPTADCAVAATTMIEVTDEVTPVLELGGEICSSGSVLDLSLIHI